MSTKQKVTIKVRKPKPEPEEPEPEHVEQITAPEKPALPDLEPEPEPEPEPTEDEPPIDLLRSVPFDEIPRGGTTDRSWDSYVGFITRMYKHLGLPDTAQFYWEYLSQPDIIDQIIIEIMNRYYVKDGKALAAKLSPFRSIVFRLESDESLSAVGAWGEAVINARKNFDGILCDLQIEVKQAPDKLSSSKTVLNTYDGWDAAYRKLSEISHKRSVDIRVRVLACIYEYGYVLRPQTIYRTYIHTGDVEYNRDTYNFMDLERCTWSIVEGGVQKLETVIPEEMADRLRLMTMHDCFSRGWILPQRRGTPYAAGASLSSFSSWTKVGLANYGVYRKLYIDWLMDNIEEDERTIFMGVLNEAVAFDSIKYIPPLPTQEIQSKEQLAQE